MAERIRRGSWLAAAIAAIAAAMLAVGAAPARACDSGGQHVFGIAPGCADVRVSAAPTATDLAPDYFQAGGHPYEFVTAVRLNAPREDDPVHGFYWPPEPLKELKVALPPGLVANPRAVPPCDIEALAGNGENPTCPSDSQVGLITLRMVANTEYDLPFDFDYPLYSIAAPPGVPARFGFNASGATTLIDAEQDRDGGLSISLKDMGQVLSPFGITVALWGVPADSGHTPARSCPGQVSPLGNPLASEAGPACSAALPPRPFLRLPTACTGSLPLSYGVASWPRPDDLLTTTIATHSSPGLFGDPAEPSSYPAEYPGLAADRWGSPRGFSGCDLVPFSPSATVRADTGAADSPTGLDVEVSQPQASFEEPEAVAESDLQSGSFALPSELSLNPSVANGLAECTAAQAGLDSASPADCPDASKIGTVELASPLLSSPLTGSIYVGALDPDQSGGTALSTYIVAAGEGVTVKLLTRLSIDRHDGRITASFGEVPQIPIGSLKLHFFGGERAPFVTPSTCGSHPASARLTPWSGTGAVELSSGLEITSGAGGAPCPRSPRERPFKPGFETAMTNLVAGATNSLTIRLSRDDGEQEPRSFELSLPAGLSAALSKVSTCPDAGIAAAEDRGGATELAAPSCPATSQVGRVTAAVGAGREPLYLQGGRVYLAGPYMGAPFSLAVVLPAVAGPLDLGTLVTRLPLKLDPGDGHLLLAGELPTSRRGVRLDLRQLTIKVDRPGFLTNPTSCHPRSVSGWIEGDSGARANVSSPLQTVGCGSLGFQPRLRTTVLGARPATRHGAHPALRMILTAARGEANLKQTTVSIAASEQLDPTRLGAICNGADFAAGSCPRGSVYGHVKAIAPLLGESLEGPVYLRRSKHNLPDLVAALGGAFELDLAGRLGYADGRMRVTMGPSPDLPISKLTLTIAGGRQGLLVNNRNLCRSPSYSAMQATAQNGKIARRHPMLEVPCGAAGSPVTGSDNPPASTRSPPRRPPRG